MLRSSKKPAYHQLLSKKMTKLSLEEVIL